MKGMAWFHDKIMFESFLDFNDLCHPCVSLDESVTDFIHSGHLHARWVNQAGAGRTVSKQWLLQDGICFGFGIIW